MAAPLDRAARRAFPPVAKAIVRRFPGKLPAYRLRLALRRARRLPGLAVFETIEARRAARTWGGRPEASVAVVIPTHGRPTQLVEAVRSVLAQTHSDLVVLVVDDGAGLPPLPADPRVHHYTLARNCGVAGVVRNVGIRASASRYLAFLYDDNVWTPRHLEVSLAAHAAGAELTYTALERVRPDGSRKDVLSVPFQRRLLRETSVADTNTLVIRRTRGVRFSRVPLRHGDFPLEDWELVHRVSRRLRTVHVPEVTVRYLVHDGSYFTDWVAAETQEARDAPG